VLASVCVLTSAVSITVLIVLFVLAMMYLHALSLLLSLFIFRPSYSGLNDFYQNTMQRVYSTMSVSTLVKLEGGAEKKVDIKMLKQMVPFFVKIVCMI
jgi:hypothetical protein